MCVKGHEQVTDQRQTIIQWIIVVVCGTESPCWTCADETYRDDCGPHGARRLQTREVKSSNSTTAVVSTWQGCARPHAYSTHEQLLTLRPHRPLSDRAAGKTQADGPTQRSTLFPSYHTTRADAGVSGKARVCVCTQLLKAFSGSCGCGGGGCAV